MLEIIHSKSNNLRAVDVAGFDNQFAVTVELKRYAADFWVTGLTLSEDLLVIMRVTLPLTESSTEQDLMREAVEIYNSSLSGLVEAAHRTGGIAQVPQAPEVLFKKSLCEAHLDLHQILGTINNDNLDPKIDMSRQYQLIKSIGFNSAIPMIARRQGLKTTTVVRRLDTAKALGMLPKSERPEHLRD
jgi:hypothetical protein